MAGVFNGIIGIIGTGIQSAFGITPIPEDASRAADVLREFGLPALPANWFSRKSSDEQTAENSEKQEFGQIGEQFAETMRLMGPACIQILRALDNAVRPESKPDDVARRGRHEYDYRPRQSTSTTKSANNQISESCGRRGSSSCSSSIQRTAVEKTIKTEKAVEASHHHFNAENMGNYCGCPKSSLNRQADGKIFSKGNGRIYETAPQDREVNLDKFSISGGISKKSQIGQATVKNEFQIREGKKNLIQARNESGKSVDSKECALCHAQFQVQSKLSLKPCGHVYCINCLFGRRITGCPKCE